MKIARARLAWGVLAVVAAGSAHAGTLVGGGSFLPALGYAGSNAALNLQVWGNSTSNTSYPIAPNSLFGVFSAQAGNPAVSYCQTDDDAGKNIFAGITIGTTEYNVQNRCQGYPSVYSGNATGFFAGLSGVNRTDLTQPNFAATDSPLNASDYNNYINNHPSGSYPVQFPAVAGAIAIVFNLVDSEDNQVTSSEVNFTDAQLCEIFSGEITNWSDTRLASAFTLPVGDSIPSNPINVQYRTDGVGTTLGLSNHLVYVCGEIKSTYFETNQAFTSVVANFFTTNGVETLPSNWTGRSGELLLVNAIANTPNSIGYMETANALATNPSLPIADVNGLSPTANFGSPLTLRGTAVAYNAVINATNATTGTAQIEYLSNISGVTNPPPTSCIALVKPALYAKPGTPGGLVPTGTYPIVAVSYLLGNSAGNGSDLTNTQNLLAFPYTVTQSSVTTIGPGTGLAFLTSTGSTALTTSQIKGCLVN